MLVGSTWFFFILLGEKRQSWLSSNPIHLLLPCCLDFEVLLRNLAHFLQLDGDFLLHLLRSTWTLARIMPTGKTLDPIISCLELISWFPFPHNHYPRTQSHQSELFYPMQKSSAICISCPSCKVWVVPVNSWGLHCPVMSVGGWQVILSSKKLTVQFCREHVSLQGVLHKLWYIFHSEISHYSFMRERISCVWKTEERSWKWRK